MILKAWMIVGFAFWMSSAQAAVDAQKQAPNCLDQGEVNALLREISFASTNPKVGQKLNLCDPKALSWKVLSALLYLKKLGPLPRVGRPLDQNILGADAWSFFRERVKWVTFRADGQGLCGEETQSASGTLGVGAYASQEVGGIFICDLMGQESELEMASTLVHEARHLDDDGYAHVDCTQGSAKGAADACDPTYRYRGSYAVGAEFALRYSKGAAVDPALRDFARTSALEDLRTRFNKPPVETVPGLVLLDQNGMIQILLGSQWIKPPVQPSGKLILTSDQTHSFSRLYSDRSLDVSRFLFDETLEQEGPSHIVEARDLPELVDVHFGKNYCCVLTREKLRCSGNASGNKAVVEISFDQLAPAGLFALNAKGDLALLTKKGSTYRLPPTLEGLKASTERSLKRIDAPIIRSTFVDGRMYGLNHSGELILLNARTKEWNAVPAAQGMRFQSLAPILYTAAFHGL